LKDLVAADVAKLSAVVDEAQNIQGLINYDPLERLMRRPDSFFPAMQEKSGIKLRLAMVALEDGALRYVTETNTMIERTGQTTPLAPHASAAQIAQLRADIQQLSADIKTMRAALGNNATPQEVMAVLQLMQELLAKQVLLAKDTVPMDLIRAAIASSSLPLICRPTPMQDGRTYVDGGIRTLAPIQAAVDIGASEVYVVAAGSQKFDSETMAQINRVAPLPLLGIALRVGEQILPDEVGKRDLFPANPYPVPVMVIQPDPKVGDIHDGLTLEPGLIRINMAYGYMRAFDTLAAFRHAPASYLSVTAAHSKLGHTTDIVELRKEIWRLEFPAMGKEFIKPASALPPAPYSIGTLKAPDAAAHQKVKAMKQQLQTLINDRIAYYDKLALPGFSAVASVPADHESWVKGWEKHDFPETIPL
jgi:predicted acylesterase/phospholipase RssA